MHNNITYWVIHFIGGNDDNLDTSNDMCSSLSPLPPADNKHICVVDDSGEPSSSQDQNTAASGI